MDDREQRIQARAYLLWQEDGQPDGRAELHWDMARSQIDAEDEQMSRIGEQVAALSPARRRNSKPRAAQVVAGAEVSPA